MTRSPKRRHERTTGVTDATVALTSWAEVRWVGVVAGGVAA